MSRWLARLWRVGSALVAVGLLLAVAVTVVIAVPGAIGAEASYVVLSDSMAPTFSSGDVVIVRSVEPAAVSPGDVITYRSPAGSGVDAERISHRVVGVERDGETTFRTKGDANDGADPYRVSESELVGRVWFVLPQVGYVVSFAGTTAGIVSLVVLPGVLLVTTELWSVYRTAVESEGER